MRRVFLALVLLTAGSGGADERHHPVCGVWSDSWSLEDSAADFFGAGDVFVADFFAAEDFFGPEFFAADFIPLTDRMRLRFHAADDPNNSLAEALVDDLAFLGFVDGRSVIWRYGTPRVGEALRVHLLGDPNVGFQLYVSTQGGFYDLGDLGIWELGLGLMLRVLGGNLGSEGALKIDATLPSNPALAGVELHLQAMMLDPGNFHFSTAVDMVIE